MEDIVVMFLSIRQALSTILVPLIQAAPLLGQSTMCVEAKNISTRMDNNEYSKTERVVAVLRRICPDVDGLHFPRVPNEPYYFEPAPYNIVWHMYKGKWYLALVLCPTVDPTTVPIYADHRLWLGLIRESDSYRLDKMTRVYLCPGVGNTKPETPYTRLLLKIHGEIANDDGYIENMVRKFDRDIRRKYMAIRGNA